MSKDIELYTSYTKSMHYIRYLQTAEQPILVVW